jgi:hypothetical protein
VRRCAGVTMGMRKHQAEPQPKSMIRERDRAPMDGNTPADYPLLARCDGCHREIRIDAALGEGWKHTAVPRLPTRVPEFREHTQESPADSNASYKLRMLLIRRYYYLTLKFTNPFVSDSGHWEASWNGGKVQAITQTEMLTKVLAELEDCGSDGHIWETFGEKRDPTNSDNLLLSQRLFCVFCDPKERVRTIFHPNPTVLESSRQIP